MTTFLLIVLAYTFVVLAVAAVGGMVRLRCLKHQRCYSLSSLANDSTDMGMDDLNIESPGSMVPVHTLTKRGSWRVALDQVMPAQTFEEMKAEEYSKKL